MTVRIGALIVDDQKDIRRLLRLLIDAENDGLFVRGEAASGEEAVTLAEELDPEVIVLDEMMPGMSGLQAAGHILARRPGQQILLCSAYLDDEMRRLATAIGVAECLTKVRIQEVPSTIRRLATAV